MISKFEEALEEISEQMENAIADADADEVNEATVGFSYGEAYIEITMNYTGGVHFMISHEDDTRRRDHSNVMEAIEGCLPEWEERESYDIWDDNGFKDEDDYTRWRYGS